VADHDDRERYLELAEATLGAFDYIRSLLEQLPVPVTVPDMTPDENDGGAPAQTLLSLNRVRQLIEDEPISERRKRAFEHMLLDWFTAYEILALTQLAGPAPWRLDAAEFALVRLTTWIEAIEEDEPSDDES
jgi:hypothetical protein